MPNVSLRDIAFVFLKLGATAFGGPSAHIGMMEDEIVRRRGWVSHERLLDLCSAANLIPGPNSTEVAIHIGYEKRGWPGLLVAGVSFIVPAMLITGLLAWAYVRYGALPDVDFVLYGVKPVILGVMAQAIFGLGKSALKNRTTAVIGALAAVAAVFGVHELIVLLGAGCAAMAAGRGGKPSATGAAGLALFSGGAALPLATPATIFWIFAKIGAVLYGSGYVLVAFLRRDFVDRLHWLTESQLLDAVAAGQVTPGPLFTTATFIGYLLQGVRGAVAATLGIFMPAFFFVAVSGPLVPKLRASKTASAFLDGVNAASLALMAVVTAGLARAAVTDLATGVLALVGAFVFLRWKPNATWLVLAGAILGWLLRRASGRA